MFRSASYANRQVIALTSNHKLLKNTRCHISSALTNKPMDPKLKQSGPANLSIVPKRYIYPMSSLGLDKTRLDGSHQRFLDLNLAHKDRYIQRLTACIETSDMDSFLVSDYIHLTNFAESEQELDLLDKLTEKLNNTGKYQYHRWANWLIRRYFRLDQIDRAYTNIMNIERFGQFFDKFSTFRMMLTWLYNEGKYQEVLEVYNSSLKRLSGNENDRECIANLAIVALGALAKINTKDALNQAEEIISKNLIHDNLSFYIKSRLITFVAYLAYNQGQYITALNYLYNPGSKSKYLSMRELRVRSWLKSGNYADLLAHITNELTFDESLKFSSEFCDMVELCYPEITDDEVRKGLQDVIENMKRSNNLIDIDLDEIIFREVVLRDNDASKESDKRPLHQSRQQNFVNRDRNFDGPRRSFDIRFEDRPGTERGQRFNAPRGRQREKSYIDEDLDSPDFPDDEQTGGNYGRNYR